MEQGQATLMGLQRKQPVLHPQRPGPGSNQCCTLRPGPGSNQCCTIRSGPGSNQCCTLRSGPGSNQCCTLRPGPGSNQCCTLRSGPGSNQCCTLRGQFQEAISIQPSEVRSRKQPVLHPWRSGPICVWPD